MLSFEHKRRKAGTMRTFLDRRESADYLTRRGLKTSPKTLQKLATVGGGPLYRIFGNRAVYEPAHLDEYADGKLSKPRRSTSDVVEDAA
jgi:hypothetical protein